MPRSLAFGLAFIFAALCWPLFVMLGALIKGWRLVSVRVVDEEELRKAGM